MFGESPGTSEVGCWEEFALKLSASFGEQSGPQDPPIMALLPTIHKTLLSYFVGTDDDLLCLQRKRKFAIILMGKLFS